MKSTLVNMVASLLGITFVASASVGSVYMLTKEPIAQAEILATNNALTQVLPSFDTTDLTSTSIDELPTDIYTAKNGDKVVGYAIKSSTMKGFSGLVVLMVGLSPEGDVINVNVLSQNETPGLGTKMTDEGNPLLLSVKDKHLADIDLRVKKDGGDVDALTAATISSRAYADAMERALKAYNFIVKKGGQNE
ncbi:MAG: RnfABCDGE type electron transport complex subunit G [Rikenellaceae bacterium]